MPTRYAVLSDIHGNVLALQAVIADAPRCEITRFINLGDIVYGPLWPRAMVGLLETIAPITIQGNQDREIHQASDEQIAASPTLQHAQRALAERHLDVGLPAYDDELPVYHCMERTRRWPRTQ